MESRNGFCLYLIILTLSCVTVVFSKDCPVGSNVEHGERIDGKVECETGYTKVGCTTPVADGVSEDYICELDVVSLSVAVALMVILIIIAIVLFSVIIRRYRKNSSRGAMYLNSTDDVIPQLGTSHAAEQDGYWRKERPNGDRVIEITMEDAATSNDFKYHEHKDEVTFENSAYVSGGYDNEGIEFEDSEYEGATGGYNIDTDTENKSNRMIDIDAHVDLEDNEVEIGFNRKSDKSKKNKSSKKKSKVKKSADKSKQKGSNKLKKQQEPEPQTAQGIEEDDINAMYAQVNKKRATTDENSSPEPIKPSSSADGLYQSMEELNEDVGASNENPGTDSKLSSVDKDVVENTDSANVSEALYAQVDKEHIALKRKKRQQDSMKARAANGSSKNINNLSPSASHTTGSDEGYGEGIEVT